MNYLLRPGELSPTGFFPNELYRMLVQEEDMDCPQPLMPVWRKVVEHPNVVFRQWGTVEDDYKRAFQVMFMPGLVRLLDLPEKADKAAAKGQMYMVYHVDPHYATGKDVWVKCCIMEAKPVDIIYRKMILDELIESL